MFRCMDCFADSLFCQTCLVSFHHREPFHQFQVPWFHPPSFFTRTNFLQQWTGTYFIQVSPRDLGAIFHLGHNYGSPCTIPSSSIPLTVFDLTGIHMINITYCECRPDSSAIPPRVQLLRAQWFPATWQRPGTAFTFRLLNFLHKLHSICKVNMYDFHNAITAVSDNAGLAKPMVSVLCCLHMPEADSRYPQFRYNELSLVFRIYVHLRQLRRGGCAHTPGGLSDLQEGALAVECPACPHPGRNIDLSRAGPFARPP